MSDYTNQLNIKVAEVVRLTFSDIVKFEENVDEIRGSVELVMHYEFFKNVHMMMGNIIKEHEETLVRQVELNKKMN